MVRSLHRLIRMPSSSGIELSHHPNDDETLLMLQARDRVSNLWVKIENNAPLTFDATHRPYYFHIHKRVEKWLSFLISFIRVLSADSYLHSVISSMRSSRASLELLPILISCLHSDFKCFEHVLRQSNSIPQHDGRGMVLFHLILSMIGWLKCYITILKELSIHKRRASRLNANTVLFRPAS